MIGEAVFARCLSALKEERTRASKIIAGPEKEQFKGDRKQFIDDLEQALYASKIISYTQGFMLMRQTAQEVRVVPFTLILASIEYVSLAGLEPELRRHCPDVAWRLYYQECLPW